MTSSVTTAAKAVGVQPKTVYDHLRDPLFRADLAEARAARLAPYVEAFHRELSPSIARLVDLRDNALSERVRLSAAEAILKHFVELDEHVNVYPRLASLEATLAV